MAENPYLLHIKQNLPRLLALFDRDRTSPSYGMGDRYYWAWSLIDFGNGTFQGAAHGMARLWNSGIWPYSTDLHTFLQRIDALFQGTRRLTRPDGSLEEAFPYEGSYCVTALAAYDLILALGLLAGDIDQTTNENWKGIIQPMIGFLIRADETHGLISNHLATAIAALVRWHNLTGDKKAQTKAEFLLQRLLVHQSVEGWFEEYQGADPGYQTLCLTYLADAHSLRPDWDLLEPLTRSVRFLWYFSHPDGSFGGLYGSRCTRFYNPAGLEALAGEIPEALALAEYMVPSISQNKVVTLSSIDEPNLIPWFNAYCWAAVLYEQRADNRPSGLSVPCKRAETKRTRFDHGGLLIDQGPGHYSIICTNKGGGVVHFEKTRLVIENPGVVALNKWGVMGSTQIYQPDNPVRLEGDTLVVESRFYTMPRRLPGPLWFIIFRLLCVTLFRIRGLREIIKRLLVRLLITKRRSWPATNFRRINLGADLSIQDQTKLPQGYNIVENPGPFVSIHMAGQGYWQVQDEAGGW
jgi:hypothetical protein